MVSKNISWINWVLCDKNEVFVVLKFGLSIIGGWIDFDFIILGLFVKKSIGGSNIIF